MNKYRIKEYEKIVLDWDRTKDVRVYKKVKRYIPQVKQRYLFGLISFWSDCIEDELSSELKAEILINNYRLREEVRKNKNVKYINK